MRLAKVLMPQGGNVVDIGCGRGYVLAGMPGSWTRIGVDPSPRAIELGRQKHPEIDLRTGFAPDAVEASLKKADLVLFLDVLEHIEGAKDLLASVVELVPPGCRVIVTVPAEKALWSAHDERHGHIMRYDREDILALWQDLPVRLRLLAPLNRRLYPIVRVVRALSSWAGRPSGNSDTDLFLPPRPLNLLLTRIFEGETETLLRALDAPTRTPRVCGVSWIAVAERAE